MVTRDPGPWFEEVLGGLAAQTYPNLAVLVIDADSEEDPTERVAATLPRAIVTRLDSNPGFGAAANHIRGKAEGAAFYLFLHDDVCLAPDSVTILVEEAFRSNAGIVGPKLVDWEHPDRIRSVGSAVDKFGVQAPYAEPGELDQEQHDRVRDVFMIAGGATLVRVDLFESIGGFDEGIDYLGDDLDLCWRAHVAGARVVVAPNAVGRHLEALAHRRGDDDRRRLQSRHRLRTVAKSYGWVHLLRVLPVALALTAGETVLALFTGRFRQARDVSGAWWWNLRRTAEIASARREMARVRRVRDSDIGRLQVRGSARMSAFLRGQIGEGARFQDLAERGRAMAGTLSEGPQRTALLVWTVMALLFVFGTRHLITRGVPFVGQFAPFPRPGSMLHAWSSGWREQGAGSAGPGPAALALLSVAGRLFLGRMGLLRQVLILGLIPFGWLGAWRLTGPLGSRRGRLAAAVVYAAIPLPLDALASGRWDVLLLYGAMPWLVLRVARMIGITPYGSKGGPPGPGVRRRSLTHQVVALGLALGIVAAFEPSIVVTVPVVALAIVVVSGFTGSIWTSVRAVVLVVISSLVALLLNLPWLLSYLDAPRQLADELIGSHRGGSGDLLDLLVFRGPRFGGPLPGLGLVVVAAVPLLLGTGWRAAWAPRAWSLALGSWAVAWLVVRGIVPFDLPDLSVILVPAAVGLAWAAALGFAAFEMDVPRFSLRWRRLAIGGAAAGLALGVLPVLGALTDGAMGVPRTDLHGALGFLDSTDPGADRILWLGDPSYLPAEGWPSGLEGVRVATSVDGLPDVRGQWAGPPGADTRSLVDVIDEGLEGGTARMGRLLGNYGVRYVVVPLAPAPSFTEVEISEADPVLRGALESQIDLRPVAADPSVLVFLNTAWTPVRAELLDVDPGLLRDEDQAREAISEPPESVPVLADRVSSTEFTGDLEPGTVVAAYGAADQWRLEVADRAVGRDLAHGWAPLFDVTRPGPARLVFERSSTDTYLLGLQLLIWVVTIRVVLSESRRRRRDRSGRRRFGRSSRRSGAES